MTRQMLQRKDDIFEENLQQEDLYLKQARIRYLTEQIRENVGASVETFSPYEDIIKSYLKSFTYTICCDFIVVTKELADALAIQRNIEGFVQLNINSESDQDAGYVFGKNKEYKFNKILFS